MMTVYSRYYLYSARETLRRRRRNDRRVIAVVLLLVFVLAAYAHAWSAREREREQLRQWRQSSEDYRVLAMYGWK